MLTREGPTRFPMNPHSDAPVRLSPVADEKGVNLLFKARSNPSEKFLKSGADRRILVSGRCYGCGLRAGEVVRLKVKHIDSAQPSPWRGFSAYC
jgi:integrase